MLPVRCHSSSRVIFRHGHLTTTCCSRRYRADGLCPYWELIVLEARFLTMFIGASTPDAPVVGALMVIAVSLGLLAAQILFKPFLETPEEAAHWSSSNKMGMLAYVCQLVVLAVGLTSIMADDLDDTATVLLSIPALVALVVPLALTAIIVRSNADVYIDTAASIAAALSNKLSDAVGEDKAVTVANPLDSDKQ